jgi:hypothetical protein
VRPLARYLRGLDPHLPRTVWLVQAGGVVNSLGNGIVFPFAVIYLHNVRGISFAQAGFALAVGGAAALATGLLAGTLIDRLGGRNTLLLGLLLQAVAFTLFPLIREPWHAYALLSLDGMGTAYREVADVREAIGEADVIYLEPVVQADYTQSRVERTGEVGRTAPEYQVTGDLMRTKAKRSSIVLHSLPRMDELLPDVDETRHQRYWVEASNGVSLRMALLALVLGAAE